MSRLGGTSQLYSVFVGHLPLEIRKQDLLDLFRGCGYVVEVYVNPPAEHHDFTYGFVRFRQAEDADRAIKDLNDWPVMGNNIKVQVAQDSQHELRQWREEEAQTVAKALSQDMPNFKKLHACVQELCDDPESGYTEAFRDELYEKICEEDQKVLAPFLVRDVKPPPTMEEIEALLSDRSPETSSAVASQIKQET